MAPAGSLGREDFHGTPGLASSLMQGLPGYAQLAGLGVGMPPWGGATGPRQGGLASAAPTLSQVCVRVLDSEVSSIAGRNVGASHRCVAGHSALVWRIPRDGGEPAAF